MLANKSPCTVALYVSIALALVFAGPVWLAIQLVPEGRAKWVEVSGVETVSRAVGLFKARGFDAEKGIARGDVELPPVFLAELPGDLRSLQDIDQRKSVFVSIVLPHVLRANQQILADRERVKRLHRALLAERTLRSRDRRWLAEMTKTYRTRAFDTEELLRRVDIVPPRLAIAQAVQESGWGTSRFARTGNALFGQHAPVGSGTISASGDSSVALKAFDNLQLSVRDYMRNLNRNRAYRNFRTMRAQMRASGRPMDAWALAASLQSYSEEGQLYVDRLRTVMSMREVAAAKAAKLSGR